jgi:hypothetical protein
MEKFKFGQAMKALRDNLEKIREWSQRTHPDVTDPKTRQTVASELEKFAEEVDALADQIRPPDAQ